MKRIANDSLGVGVLRSMFSHANTYHLIIKISDGAFIGFSLYHFREDVLDGETYVTGVIDCVCVDKQYRRGGFGTLITFGTLRKMSAHGVDRVELMLKSPPDKTGSPGFPLEGSEQLLGALGFRLTKTYDNHFEKVSRKFAYECQFCGDAPDTCRGLLYSINGRE